MVEKIGFFTQQNNYNTIQNSGRTKRPEEITSGMSAEPSFTAKTSKIVSNNAVSAPAQNINLRTSLSTKEEKQMYSEVLSNLDRSGKKIMETLLKSGILLNNNSNDKSSVLDNL